MLGKGDVKVMNNEFPIKRYYFGGLANNNIQQACPISYNEFKFLTNNLLPYSSNIDLYCDLWEILKYSWIRYKKFIYFDNDDEPLNGDLDMYKITVSYEHLLVDYILKSSLLVNNIRTRNNKVIRNAYKNKVFCLFTLLRNLLEHNQIPLKNVKVSRNLKLHKNYLKSFVDKNIMYQFVNTPFQKRNKKYYRYSIEILNHFSSKSSNYINISKNIIKYNSVLKRLVKQAIDSQCKKINGKVFSILYKYYNQISSKKFHLRYIAKANMTKDNYINPRNNIAQILNRKTYLCLIRYYKK